MTVARRYAEFSVVWDLVVERSSRPIEVPTVSKQPQHDMGPLAASRGSPEHVMQVLLLR